MSIYTSNLMPHLVRSTGLSAQTIVDLFARVMSISQNRELYKIYNIRQGKRGKKRTIQEPQEDLKKIQKALIPIFERYQLSPWCTAVRGGSAVINAQRHVGAKYILKVDIKECYPNITARMIHQGLNMQRDSLEGYNDIIDAVWFGLFPKTDNVVRILPTGAPTSPILCNIALTPIDYIVINMLRNRYGDKYTYSRYLDDMIISTSDRRRDWIIKEEVENILTSGGLRANHKKTKWMDARDDDMIVTGVHVYETRGGVPRAFWRKIRSRLQHLAQEGKDLDAETKGCLAYIKSIDLGRYDSLLAHFERRKNYVPPTEQQCVSPEQIFHGSTGDNS